MPRQSLIQVRAGTSAQWASANPVLATGEPGYDTDTGVLKFGNGVHTWSVLPSITGGGGGGGGPATAGLTPTAKTGDYTAQPGELVLMNATADERQVTFPTAVAAGDTVGVIKTDATANEVRLYAGAKTINGDADAVLTSRWAGAEAVYDGTNWVLTSITAVTTATATGGGGGGGGGSTVTIDADGTLTVDGDTVELATDQDVTNAIAGVLATRAATDLANVAPATIRSRAGLGNAATLNVGTSAGTLAAGDDSRFAGGVRMWQPSTAYTAGTTVLTPHGRVVRAITTHTSASQYNPALWMYLGGQRRAAEYWPFSHRSIFNLPIAETAVWEKDGDARTQTLRSSSSFPWVAWEAFSIPIVRAKRTDPVAQVTDTGYSPRSDRYRIPIDATPSAGTDRAMAVIDPTGRWSDETWLTTKTSDTSWTVARHEHIDLYGQGIGPVNGIHASASSLVGGHILYTDYLAGEIPHNLVIGVDGTQLYYQNSSNPDADYGYSGTGGSGYVWPATEQDANASSTYNTSPGALPMGQAFGIPPTVDVEALPVTDAGKMIARALQRYGGFICDRTTATTGISAEPAIPGAWINQARTDMLTIVPLLVCIKNSTEATPNGGALLEDGSNRLWEMAPPLPPTPPMI